MKVANFDHQKAAKRLEAAHENKMKSMLDDFQQHAELLLQDKASIHEMINCICEAINTTQIVSHDEDSREYNDLQFYHDVIESTTYALELDRRPSPEISKANGLIEMQNRLEKIKQELS